MKTGKIISILVVVLFFIRSADASNKTAEKDIKHRVSSKQKWKGRKSVRFKLIKTLGTDDYDQENYVFGHVTDVKIDQNGNIYVLDLKNNRIQKYSQAGNYLQSLQGKPGQGPGDLSSPRLFTLDRQQNIFVNDLEPRRVVMFNSNGGFMRSITLQYYPGDLIAANNEDLYVSEMLRRNPAEFWLHKYKIPGGQWEKDLCKKDPDNNLVHKTDYCGYLAVDQKENIFFSLPWPYCIRKFSKEGVLLGSFSRKGPFTQPPVDNGHLIRLKSRSVDLIYLREGILISVFRWYKQKAHPLSYLDFFDENGDWLITVPTAEIDPDWMGRVVVFDPDFNMYLDFTDPYPHVKIYSMEIIEH